MSIGSVGVACGSEPMVPGKARKFEMGIPSNLY